MADFIQGQPPQGQPAAPQGPPPGQQAQTQQQRPVQPGPAAPSNFLSTADKSQLADQAAQQAGSVRPPPPGPRGAGMGATQENPLEAPEEEASPMEQAQYEDLFLRVMAAVNDTRKPPGGQAQSPADATVKLLSSKDRPAHEAIGTAAALIMIQIIDLSKRSNVQYDPRVVQEVGMDLVVELADIADQSGAIRDMPEEDSEEYAKLIELSVLEGAKIYGEWQLRTGQAPRQQAMGEIDEQMQREADAGELDDWQMEELDPQMRQQLMQSLKGGGPQQGAQQGGFIPQQGGMPNG